MRLSMEKNFWIKGLALLSFVILFAACGDDKPAEPEIAASDDIKVSSVKTTALTASIIGKFDGISKIDFALGEKGVLYCVKKDNAESIFKSWLEGNDNPDCENFTNGSIQGGEYVSIIRNLSPETEYSFCVYSKSKDGKTRKISSVSTFKTAVFNPVFKAFEDISAFYVSVWVQFKKIAMDDLDAASSTYGLLVSTKSGAEAGPESTLTPFNGSYEEWDESYSMFGYGIKPDSSYYCRLYVQYKAADGSDAYKYGPESTFSAKTSNDLAVDMNLPSGLKWARCDLGEYGVDALADDRNSYLAGWQYFHWGSLKMFKGLRNVAANKNAYEYWDAQEQDYTFLGNDIKGTEYDAAHVMLGGKWRLPTKAEVQELIDSTFCTTWGVGHGTESNMRYGSGLIMSRDSSSHYDQSVQFVISIGGFWTSSYENGYPVAYDIVADEIGQYGYVSKGHMEFVTGKGGEYARHIRPVWDPNM